MKRMNRRRFLGMTAAAPLIVPSGVLGRNPPSERITMGCIGVGGMGMRDLRAALSHDDVPATR